MDKLVFSVIIGLVAGIIDIIPMIVQKLPRYSTVAAFFHYFFCFDSDPECRYSTHILVVRGGGDWAYINDSDAYSCGTYGQEAVTYYNIQCHSFRNTSYSCRTLFAIISHKL